MKTSNKLLITLGLGILLGMGLIQIILYSHYRQGRIVSSKQLHAERYTKYAMAAPAYLSLNGIMWVNIIPSDTFYVEFPKTNGSVAEERKVSALSGFANDMISLSYRQSGDTLLITGNNHEAVHRAFADQFYRRNQAQVNVYCRGLKDITITNGQLYLHGAGDRTSLPSAKIHISGSTLWIGDYQGSKTLADEFFDSLDIRSFNGEILLNKSALIHKLQIQLDDASELNDRQAKIIDSLIVNYSNDSRVGLTGANLKKAKLLAH